MHARLVLLLAASSLLAGCPSKNKKEASCEVPRDSVTVAVAAMPNTLDWSNSHESSWQNYPVVHAMMRGLTALDDQHRPVPGLAETWEVSTDEAGHQVYTFHLRDGVVWSDGTSPLTARDFVFGWRRAILGNETAEMADIVGSDAIHAIRGDASIPAAERKARLAKAVEAFAVEAVDARTLRVTLEAPKSYFLARLAYVYTFFPAPAADLEGKSDAEISRYFDEPAGGKPMTLGAFTVESWDRVGKSLRLARNPHARVANDGVRSLTLLQADLSPLLYDRCKVDFLAMDDPATLRSAPADVAHSELLSTLWLGMNTATMDLPLRRAVAHAIQREEMMAGLLPRARLAHGYLPPALPGSVASDDPRAAAFPRYDVAKAKALRKTSKYDGRELTLLVKSTGTFMPETGIADAVKRQLAEIGVKVTLVTTSDFGTDVKKADGSTRHDLFIKRTGADYAHPQTFFTVFMANGSHYTGWQAIEGGAAVKEFEALLAKGAAETDAARMTETYTAAQAMLLDRYAVMVPLYHPDRYYRRRTWIEGLGVDPFNFLTFRTMTVKEVAKR